MFNKQLKKNIKDLDAQIQSLIEELFAAEDVEEHGEILKRIDELTEVRNKLSHDKVNESHAGAIISGALGIASMAMVLKFEKADIITSKAFGMATSMFRGK